MTLYRNIFENTRPLFLATAAGAAMCSMSMGAYAQHHATHAAGTAPRLLPQGQVEVRPLAGAGQSVELASGQMSNADYRQTQKMVQDDNLGSGRQVAFQERLKGLFRSKPTTPPVDPGMTYPKASDRPAGPPPVPGASADRIPSIPPTYGSGTQPGIFHPVNNANAIGANSIGNSDIPSIPPAMGQESAPPGISTASGAGELPLTNIPELKALMTAENQPPSTGSPEIAQDSKLPTLDFNAPLPQVTPQIAPGEPVGPAAVTAAAPKMEKDPFADLFPEDNKPSAAPPAKTTAATQTPTAAPASPPSATESMSPYTGRSLNEPEPAAMQTAEALPPPPLESLPQIPTLPPVASQMKEIKTAELPALDLPPTAAPAQVAAPAPAELPQLPKLETAEPKELPRLTGTPAPQMQITPAKPPVQSAAASGASSDQRSKLELIAARKDLKGLKGFCPVELRDARNLVDASPDYTVSYNGREFAVSSPEARSKFMAEPQKYAPAAGCCDVIHLALTGEHMEGSLEHAVWYRGRLYLFAGVETMETFVAAPSSHATDE